MDLHLDHRLKAWSHFAVARFHRQTLLWFSLWLLGIPVGLLGFLSMLFWVYGVDG